MDRIRKTRWIGWSLPILAGALIFVDFYSGHIERSISLFVLALAIGLFGLGLYTWAITTPGEPVFVLRIDPKKHPILMRVLFFGAVIVLGGLLIKLTFFESQSMQPQKERSPLFVTVWLLGYWLLVAFIRYLRARKHNSVNI